MDDTGVVRVLQSRTDLTPHVDRLFPGELSPFLQHILQRTAVNELHYVVALVVFRATAVVLDDVGMIESLEDRNFAVETPQQFRVGHQSRGKDFDGDFSLVPGIGRHIDDTHTANADLLLEDKRTNLSYCHDAVSLRAEGPGVG